MSDLTLSLRAHAPAPGRASAVPGRAGAVMTTIERTLAALIVLTGLLVFGWLGVMHYGGTRYDAGYAAAVAEGKTARDAAAEINRIAEADLRAQLHARDSAAHRKEQEHAQGLAAAQRRMRAGYDRLRCPAGPVPATAAPGDRPATTAPGADGPGPELVPEFAAEILADGADIARIVRQYDQVVERFEACRAVNAR